MINKDLKFIADHYGLEGQTKKCDEELNELIEALGGSSDIHLAEEIADIEIMISQIKYLRTYRTSASTVLSDTRYPGN